MNYQKIILAFAIFCFASCSSAENKENVSDNRNEAAGSTAAEFSDETIHIYGLIKVEGDNVFLVTNWKSRSMVTYTVEGSEKSELAVNAGKYAEVSGILKAAMTWSGVIEIKKIISIDEMPDKRKEKMSIIPIKK